MKTNHRIINILLCIALLSGITSNKVSAESKAEVQNNKKEISTKPLSFSERGKPRALDLYWHRMAQCETGGNWKDGGTWSGGLGIYKQTWSGYGGKEFASKPEFATIDEQIIVANRISTQGYQTKNEFLNLEDRNNNKPFFRPPVGFGGWGCKKNVGNPVLFKKFPAETLLRKYKLGERGSHIISIQKIIGTQSDGYFGPVSDKYYNKFFSKYRKVIIAEYEKYKK